jgi:hypothetical protein
MHAAHIQIDMFAVAPGTMAQPTTFTLMRPHKWAHAPVGEVELAEIEVAPHDGKWMWGVWIDSRNGSAQGYKPFAKWGKFASSRADAVRAGVDEVRAIMHRTTPEEQERISTWLGQVLGAL